jgi:hypothetical protein
VKAQLNQRNAQFSAELAARLENDGKQRNLQRAVAAMNATKLGENENYATRNRILSTIIPNPEQFEATHKVRRQRLH